MEKSHLVPQSPLALYIRSEFTRQGGFPQQWARCQTNQQYSSARIVLGTSMGLVRDTLDYAIRTLHTENIYAREVLQIAEVLSLLL